MPLPLIFEQIINGLVVGSMYALVASGLTLIWGAMRMLNFAHGEFYMIGGYLLLTFLSFWGMPALVAVPFAVLCAFMAGVAVERIAVHPLLSRPQWEFSTIVSTLAVSILMQNGALHLFGKDIRNVPYFLNGVVSLFGMRLSYQRLLILAVAIMVMAGMWFLISRSRFGRALRATAMDRDAARLYGVDVNRIYTLTFGIAAGLSALAACMLSSINSINPWMGTPVILKGFVVVVLGGLGSFHGAIIGGLIIGLIEAGSVILWSSQWREVVSFSILILILWLRPWGLFGARES